ncbi:proteoglycan 4-like [Cebidichthys violaceus]|uniref:proteoglycan 4-like n=1 Tax=Cebidichthys violaceus TaxID=271503 RepID=UPI0035CAACEF
MAEFRWIVTSSFLMLQVLSFGAAIWKPSSFTVRDGDEVTLPCENVRHDQNQCDGTTWIFTDSGNTVTLFEHGKIHEAAKAKSDRLSVSENCSLVLKKVTDKDGGLYVCRQFRSGQTQQEGEDAGVYLSVVTMTEQKNNDEVKLSCSVSTLRWCKYRVKWLNEDDQNDVMTSQDVSTCSAWLRMKQSHLDQKSKFLLKCEVTRIVGGEMHQFPFSPPQSSDDAATKTTSKSPTKTTSKSPTKTTSKSPTKTTTKSPTKTTTKSPTTSTTRNESGVMTNNKTPENITNEKPESWWWILLFVSVGVAAVLIITVSVITWKRTKGNRTKTCDDVADPEEGVSYASVSYTKKTNSKARAHIQHDDEDEDDAVTYSTVKLPSSSAAASADPSQLYATVNKPKK